MTIRRSDEGILILDGDCAVEEAEFLLQMLQATPGATVDWTQCRQLHTAVLQVIMASGNSPIGPCGDVWVQQWLVAKTAPKGAGGITIPVSSLYWNQLGNPAIYPLAARV